MTGRAEIIRLGNDICVYNNITQKIGEIGGKRIILFFISNLLLLIGDNSGATGKFFLLPVLSYFLSIKKEAGFGRPASQGHNIWSVVGCRVAVLHMAE